MGARRAARWIAAPGLLLALAVFAAPATGDTRVANPREVRPTIDLPDSLLFARSEFGLLFGSPSLFNLEAGYWGHPIVGVRASGFYWGRGFAGFQGNLCVTATRGRRARGAVALVAGRLFSDVADWKYAGLAWDWNLAPLFLEAGVVYGSGELAEFDRLDLALIFQVGLMGGGGVIGPR